MGLPSINITFSEEAAATAAASGKGITAVIVKDTAETGGHALTKLSHIPETLTAANRAYITRAFTGYVNRPSKVLVYVINAGEGSGETVSTALAWLATQRFDWLACAPDISADDCTAVAAWIAEQRSSYHAIYKAVLPNYAGDSEAIVNFTGAGIVSDKAAYAAGDWCSRIAGILSGTPYTQSATYAPLSEVGDITRLSDSEADAATDAGKLILLHDGSKVKLGRAVTSLTTTTAAKGAQYKKIHIVDLIDRIQYDLRTLIADNYIGKYTNSYDNQCILLTAVSSYFGQLEAEQVVQTGWAVSFDTAAKEAWLTNSGVDTAEMTDDEIIQYASGSSVFIKISCKLLDAIEDVTIAVTI